MNQQIVKELKQLIRESNIQIRMAKRDTAQAMKERRETEQFFRDIRNLDNEKAAALRLEVQQEAARMQKTLKGYNGAISFTKEIATALNMRALDHEAARKAVAKYLKGHDETINDNDKIVAALTLKIQQFQYTLSLLGHHESMVKPAEANSEDLIKELEAFITVLHEQLKRDDAVLLNQSFVTNIKQKVERYEKIIDLLEKEIPGAELEESATIIIQ